MIYGKGPDARLGRDRVAASLYGTAYQISSPACGIEEVVSTTVHHDVCEVLNCHHCRVVVESRLGSLRDFLLESP